MKTIKISFLSLCLIFIAQAVVKAQPTSGNAHPSVNAKVDQLVKSAVNEFTIPGMTIAVTKKGRLVVNKAYGYANHKEQKAMKPYHRTGIGSVSKIITALGVMKLVEDKSDFHLDKKLFGSGGVLNASAFTSAIQKGATQQNRPYLKNWYRSMKVNHLLTHTSGIGGYPDRDKTRAYFNVSEYSLAQQLQYYIIHDRLLFEPGTDKKYTNYGMGNVIRAVIEKKSGMGYGIYIDKKIFRPLGLHGDIVSFKHPKDKYDSDRHEVKNGKIITKKWEYNGPELASGAAGGWAASARSLARIMVATDKLSNYKDLLKPSTINEMEQRPYNVSGAHAIGWGYGGNGKRLSHNGSGGGGKAIIIKYKPGYISQNGTDLSDINVAICVNYKNIDLGELGKLAGKLAVLVGQASIPASYDLFPSTDPAPPSNGGGKPGTVGGLKYSYKWSKGWSTAKFFKVGGNEYVLLLKAKGFTSKGKNLHVNKINSNGSVGELVFSYKVSEGWTDAEFFKRGNKTYLLLLRAKGLSSKGKNLHINLVNSNGTIGKLEHSYKISEGWTDAEVYKRGSGTYLMLVKAKGFSSKGYNVHINKINGNGSVGSLVKGYKFSQGWTDAEVYKRGSKTYLMLLKEKGYSSKGKNVHINVINSNGTIGNLAKSHKIGQGWTNAEIYKKGDKTLLLLVKEKGYSSKEKNVHINLINSSGGISSLQASYKWSEGWSQARIFKRGNSSFLFLLKESGYSSKGKNVHINKIM